MGPAWASTGKGGGEEAGAGAGCMRALWRRLLLLALAGGQEEAQVRQGGGGPTSRLGHAEPVSRVAQVTRTADGRRTEEEERIHVSLTSGPHMSGGYVSVQRGETA